VSKKVTYRKKNSYWKPIQNQVSALKCFAVFKTGKTHPNPKLHGKDDGADSGWPFCPHVTQNEKSVQNATL